MEQPTYQIMADTTIVIGRSEETLGYPVNYSSPSTAPASVDTKDTSTTMHLLEGTTANHEDTNDTLNVAEGSKLHIDQHVLDESPQRELMFITSEIHVEHTIDTASEKKVEVHQVFDEIPPRDIERYDKNPQPDFDFSVLNDEHTEVPPLHVHPMPILDTPFRGDHYSPSYSLFNFNSKIMASEVNEAAKNSRNGNVHEGIGKIPQLTREFQLLQSQHFETTHEKSTIENGKQFVVNDQPFYVNRFNTYWLMVLAVDESTRGKVTEVFKQASAVGLTVCRTWAFNDGQWRALQKFPSVYDEEVFKALDFVVSEASKYKMRLIFSLVNNWDAYGGKAQYVKWGKDASHNLTSNDDFFSHPTFKSYYKAHVKAVLNRVNTFTNITYKDDTTIFAWELMNEPRCESDPSGDKLQAWVEERAMYVKSIDPKQLVENGSEGFYGLSTPNRAQVNPNTYAQQVGTDFIRNHQVLGVEFASVHIYPDSWISPTVSDSHREFTKSWMQSHIDDAKKYLNMPVIFTEFGVSAKDIGYNSTYKDTLFSTVYKAGVG